ncbi:hypothetical protein FOL47_008889 [Perkinsus chesapeaki]|uniref:Uncharacterized protein n=1 Tax=Perkinsus chesapeaki TaxID=330153 RepID=A0A7J6LBE0_PERCH|nr:hypothetical protein FOL47_008889 [Perkinsus chesapeaki]
MTLFLSVHFILAGLIATKSVMAYEEPLNTQIQYTSIDPKADCAEVMRSLISSVMEVATQLSTLKDTSYAMAGDMTGRLSGTHYTASELANTSSVLFPLVSSATQMELCVTEESKELVHLAILSVSEAMKSLTRSMWHMVNLGSFGDYGSPYRNIGLLLDIYHPLFQAINLVNDAVEQLGLDRSPRVTFGGHEPDGMFTRTVVMYRKLFPEKAHLDKGLLRTLLRLLPKDSSLCDFGALDGRYATWLNDTGLIKAFAIDGVRGISELTNGAVTEADLTTSNLKLWTTFDCVLSLEVAEHIPKQYEGVFLDNLGRHAQRCLIISWALPDSLGEGHVNSLAEGESHRRIVERIGLIVKGDAFHDLS